ncbi:MAG: DUF542 domain-containing protein [Chloroflexi bacterium]|nr:DUF542 domain-containing protein [Chloroflexota bacterium]
MSANLTSEMTVEQIVRRYPKALRILVPKGIDCCCGAGKKLSDAAAEKGLDVYALVEDLKQAVSV